MADMGVWNNCQSDNSIFAANQFITEIEKRSPEHKFGSVIAHPQNGITECVIQTILTKSHSLLIHATLCWPDMVDASCGQWQSTMPLSP